MSLITRMRRQVALYWAPKGNDLFNSDTFDEPIEIACRWEDTQKEIIAANGEKKLTSAIVYVDRELKVGGVLAKRDGTENQHTPDKNTRQRIVAFGSMPNLRNTESLLTAYLGQ